MKAVPLAGFLSTQARHPMRLDHDRNAGALLAVLRSLYFQQTARMPFTERKSALGELLNP